MDVLKRSEFCGVVDEKPVPNVTMNSNDIRRGTVFSGKPGTYGAGVFFKTDSGFVRLSFSKADNRALLGYQFNEYQYIADYEVLNATLVIDD